jgi:AmmeMemoRadiSam system protein B/AmmeMemoRadiSam system protein A
MKHGFFLLLLPFFLTAAEDVRPYLNTGPWYPADAAQLKRMLDGFFSGLPQPPKGESVRGIVAPHAGFEYSGRCAARAYAALSPAQGIRRVILLGPSHRTYLYGACLDDYAAWSTPLGRVAVDAEARRALAKKKLFQTDRDTMRFEHSLENQLPFLQRALGSDGYTILPIVVGMLKKGDFAVLADAIAPYVDAGTLVVASSDMTHFGENFSYTPFRADLAANLTKLDQGFIDPILHLDFDRFYAYHEKTGITACGFVPIGVMIRLFAKRNLRGAQADYYKSGDLSGDYSTSVSYASLLFSEGGDPAAGPGTPGAAGGPIGLDADEQRLLLELARATLRDRFQDREPKPGWEGRYAASPRLAQSLGVFVTLRKGGDLRGCIGSIVGVQPLYRGVAANALHAAFDDPRFPPLRQRELDGVDIEISVMTPLQPISDYRAIRLGRDGVIIRDGMAQAVFLPQVATETGWTLDEFLGNLCLKAGLDADAYRRSRRMQFLIFQAQVFGEKEAAK